MTRWFAWFKGNGKVPHFRLVLAESLEVAEMMANDLANRDKLKLIGVIVASELFNSPEK